MGGIMNQEPRERIEERLKAQLEMGGTVVRLAALILLWLGTVMMVLLARALLQGEWGGVSKALITIVVCVALLNVIHKCIVATEGKRKWWTGWSA